MGEEKYKKNKTLTNVYLFIFYFNEYRNFYSKKLTYKQHNTLSIKTLHTFRSFIL